MNDNQLHAHIERSGQCIRRCSGVVRVFDGDKQYGDPYRIALPFVMQDERTVEFIGLAGRGPSVSEWRAVERACVDSGITRAVWLRRGGRTRTVVIERGR